jgi:hypothetical protein
MRKRQLGGKGAELEKRLPEGRNVSLISETLDSRE